MIFCIFSVVKDKETVKYAVLGRPILLALEEVDGTPSFLEKALRFIEEHGRVSFQYVFVHTVTLVFLYSFKTNMMPNWLYHKLNYLVPVNL
jgi:hypothetical protein